MRFSLMLPALLLLPGCANLQQLRELNPPANDFHSSLAAEYLAYAESEEEQGHSSSANYYAGKGLKAAKGKDVLPEKPGSNLPESQKAEIQAAYKDLGALLNEDVKRVSPQKLARLQLLYDCWYQQASVKKPEEVSCSDEFKPAAIELENIAQLLLYSEVKTYKIAFRYNSERLTLASANTVNKVVRDVAALKDFVIVIGAGSAVGKQQQGLQERRRKTVYDLLVKAGIPEKRMREYSEGDSKRVHLSKDAPVAVNNRQAMIMVKTPKVNNELAQDQ